MDMAEKIEDIAEAVIARAAELQLTIVTAESCTAGALSHILAAAPGAGSVLHGGYVSYSKEFKIRCLGVPLELIAAETAVSEGVAVSMARCALKCSPGADVAVAITGVLGPEPDEDGNPVGLLYIAAVCGDRLASERLDGKTERSAILQRALGSALGLLDQVMSEDNRVATG
jgi:nicotinamide-nucleotide amidase